MNSINFSDIIDLLKDIDNSQVKETVCHDDGVYRKSVIYVAPYTVTIEYIEFNKNHVPLKFTASKDGSGETIHFRSIESFMATLGITV